jgi:hypothetical protein
MEGVADFGRERVEDPLFPAPRAQLPGGLAHSGEHSAWTSVTRKNQKRASASI